MSNALQLVLLISILFSNNVYKSESVQKDSFVEQSIKDTVSVDAASFKEPWKDTSRSIIIDAYKLNTIDWDKLKTDPRIVGVIHKSSEGLTNDTKYKSRRLKAKTLGYKWGSYHLGRRGNPVEQADHYLSHIEQPEGELIALDLEDPRNKKYMTLKEATLFINRIYEKTNRYPVIYCNHAVLKMISKQYGKQSVFSKCPLWYARFVSEVKDFDNQLWDTYALWQFSSELNCKRTGHCLYNAPGTKFDMDINVCNGIKEDVVKNWPNF